MATVMNVTHSPIPQAHSQLSMFHSAKERNIEKLGMGLGDGAMLLTHANTSAYTYYWQQQCIVQ